MVSGRHPIAFMLRCRQANSLATLHRSWKSPKKFQSVTETRRAASTTSSSPAPSTTPTRTPFSSQSPSTQDQLPWGTYSPTHRRPTQIRTAPPLNLWTAIKSIFGWKPTPATYIPAPFNAINNPYRARKKWPPDFTTLHPKHQFHFEKTYRRRLKLKYARPRWIKGTKIAQFALMLVIVGYWIFYLEVEGKEGTPFDAVSEEQGNLER